MIENCGIAARENVISAAKPDSSFQRPRMARQVIAMFHLLDDYPRDHFRRVINVRR